MIRLPYDPKTGEFKGLYETIGYLVVKAPLRKFLLTTDLTVKNQKFYIYITEREFQTLLPGQFSTVIGR